jgi:hypothetical protein
LGINDRLRKLEGNRPPPSCKKQPCKGPIRKTEWKEINGSLVLLKDTEIPPLCEGCPMLGTYGALHDLRVIHNAYGSDKSKPRSLPPVRASLAMPQPVIPEPAPEPELEAEPSEPSEAPEPEPAPTPQQQLEEKRRREREVLAELERSEHVPGTSKRDSLP